MGPKGRRLDVSFGKLLANLPNPFKNSQISGPWGMPGDEDFYTWQAATKLKQA